MAEKSLAVKYRPKTFDDVSEQGAIKTILTQQLVSGTTKNAYLFCGGAGTGKTTCARIFANEINKHQGNPIELDAASNNSVDDVREIIAQSKVQSLESEYKVFIIDECHSLSNQAWQAFLKVLEEPPMKSIFIFCTTDPQKIPKTILSRVQRYDFQRISKDGIVKRLDWIWNQEFCGGHMDCLPINGETRQLEALDYIAKIADGGMRDAITLMDKCIAYNTNLTLENVIIAIGATDYDVMFDLLSNLYHNESQAMLTLINDVHMSGKDLKLFVRTFTNFILDVNKFVVTESFEFLQIPSIYAEKLSAYKDRTFLTSLLKTLVQLNSDIKWDTNPKASIEATFLLFGNE